ALAKAAGAHLGRATLYTSLEPCSVRRSRSRTCTELILAAGIRRVVFAMREPPTFADCRGFEELDKAGVDVVELTALAGLVRAATPPWSARAVLRPAPDAVRPAPDAVRPAPDAVRPAPDAVRPAPDGVRPAPAPRR